MQAVHQISCDKGPIEAMIVAGSTEAAPQQAEADKLEQNNPMAERRASGSHPENISA